MSGRTKRQRDRALAAHLVDVEQDVRAPDGLPAPHVVSAKVTRLTQTLRQLWVLQRYLQSKYWANLQFWANPVIFTLCEHTLKYMRGPYVSIYVKRGDSTYS